MSDIWAVDFETYWSRKLRYTLKLQIAETYCKHPLFDPYLLSVSNGTETWAGETKTFDWHKLEGKTLLSHNAAFDQTVYNEMVTRGWAPKIQFKEWLCTANMSAYLSNRRSLAAAAEHLLKVKLDKDPRDKSDGKHWADFSETEKAEMLVYAKTDALRCWQLFDRFGPSWPAWERRLSALTIEQGQRGLQIDVNLLNESLLICHDAKTNTEALIPWVGGCEDPEYEDFGGKPTSTRAIADQCRKVGIPCPPVKSRDGEEAFLEWEEQYGSRYDWIAALSSWRSLNKIYKTLSTIKERLRDDGSIPFSLKYAGAHTLRWSGDGRLNMQNFPRLPYVINRKGLLETSNEKIIQAAQEKKKTGKLPDWAAHSVDLRNLIIPRPGKKFVIADLAQVEPRILNYLCGNYELLDLVRKGFSIYEAFWRTSAGWYGGNLKKENEQLYALAKASCLGLGYGCGWKKFIVVAQAMAGLDVTKDDPEFVEQADPITGELKPVSGYGTNSRRIVEDFRKNNPKIVALWQSLDEAFKRSIGADFSMVLPSGRSMRYEKVRAETRIEADPETKKPRRKTIWTADIGGRRFTLYGGLFAENITQSCARDVFAYGMLALEDAGYSVLLHIHDEVICEVPVDNTAAMNEIQGIMSQTPPWLAGCPLAAEAHESAFYKK